MDDPVSETQAEANAYERSLGPGNGEVCQFLVSFR